MRNLALQRVTPRHELPPLPYAEDALAPYVSAHTVRLHHDGHHRAYVDNTNRLTEGTGFTELTLEELVQTTPRDAQGSELFDNAAQAWNHAFYWNSMCPGGGKLPRGPFRHRLERDFGDLAAFRARFLGASSSLFGSGWVWLIERLDRLEVVATSNADTPLVRGQRALLTMDVWEHAYYLDYENRRADYAAAFFDHLANWEFAAANLARGRGR